MNLRQLRIFLKICDTESFTQAARQLYMTQPAVSHAISELEQEIGTSLFERTSKKVVLTPSGRLLHKKAAYLISVYDELEKELVNLDVHAPIRLGSSITIAHELLINRLALMKERYPKLSIEVRVASSETILKKLSANELDVALVEGSVPADQYEVRTFSAYEIAAVCAPCLLANETLTLHELIRKPLLLREKGSALREVVDSALLLNDLQVSPAWTSTNSSVLMKAACEGMGIAFLPASMVNKKVKEGKLKRLTIKGVKLISYNHWVVHSCAHLSEPMRVLLELVEQGSGDGFEVDGKQD